MLSGKAKPFFFYHSLLPANLKGVSSNQLKCFFLQIHVDFSDQEEWKQYQ